MMMMGTTTTMIMMMMMIIVSPLNGRSKSKSLYIKKVFLFISSDILKQ